MIFFAKSAEDAKELKPNDPQKGAASLSCRMKSFEPC